MKNRALFLDRDGIINEDVRYPHLPEHITFCKGIFDLCKKAIEKKYLLIVVTNQAGVAKGYFTEDDVKRLHEWMKQKFFEKGIEITAFYYCPYHEKGTVAGYSIASNDRKPRPGMFLKAAKEYAIDFTQSLMVGDKTSDRIEIPELHSVIVKSGYTTTGYDVASLEEVLPFLT